MLSGFKALIRISMPTHRQTIVSKILLPLLMIKKIIIITIIIVIIITTITKTVMQRAISCGCAVSRLPMDVGFRQLRLETLDHSVVFQRTAYIYYIYYIYTIYTLDHSVAFQRTAYIYYVYYIYIFPICSEYFWKSWGDSICFSLPPCHNSISVPFLDLLTICSKKLIFLWFTNTSPLYGNNMPNIKILN